MIATNRSHGGPAYTATRFPMTSLRHGNTISVRARLLLLSAVASALATIDPADLPPLPDAPEGKNYSALWKKHGAYYDKDDLVVISKFSSDNCSSRIEVFKQIKIISIEGAAFGTIPVYRYAPRISKFEPRLTDAENRAIKLDAAAMKENYRESGKVVFPQVTAGSTLSIRIEFIGDFYYTHFSNWFSNGIPTRIGRFAHRVSSGGRYDYKTFGARGGFEYNEYKKGTIKSWTVTALEPRARYDYQEHASVTEPRIFARLRRVNCWSGTYNSPKETIKAYKREYDGVSMDLKSVCSVENVLKTCCEGVPDPEKKARNILRWVQDNMRSNLDKSDFFQNVVATGNASETQIACLCCWLFNKAGVKSYPVVAGSNDFFAVDTSFLFWSDWLTTGLPIVILNGRTLAAYPFARGYELGEYPLGFRGVRCINLKEKQCQPLPPPLWNGKQTFRERRILDFRSENGVHRIVLEYRENYAGVYRDILMSKSNEDQKSYFEKHVKRYGASNTLATVSISDMDVYEKPLTVRLSFSSEAGPIPHGTKRIVKLNDFFADRFKDITPDRSEDVVVYHPETIIDELEIMKIPGKKLTVDMATAPLRNPLFTASYETAETDSSLLFTRTLTVPQTNHRFSMAEIRDGIYADIITLNGIKNAGVIIE